jgi:hypothetical protein
MSLGEIPSATEIFIDANIFVYHFWLFSQNVHAGRGS